MKQTIKILFFVSIGLLIGYFIADYNLENEPEISIPEKAETIVELMGTETTFGVKGNCKMCKKTIETAALSLDGVHKAVWDVETKQIVEAKVLFIKSININLVVWFYT